MWLRGYAATPLLVLASPGSALAQDRFEVATIAGPLRAVCIEGAHGSVATYVLNGRRVPGLDHGCETPQPAVTLSRIWESPRNTTLLLVAASSEEARLIRLIHVPIDAAPVAVEFDVDHATSARQLSTNRFRLLQQAHDPEENWTCQYDIDFAASSVAWRVVRSSDPDLDDSACGAELITDLQQ